ADLLDLAQTLIAKKAAAFDPGKFRDHYVDALRDLVQRKLKAKGRKIVDTQDESAAPRGTNVVDLMAALKKSLDRAPEAAPAPRARRK
ncbi:Ku protein, partial [Acinetobacter baumannii]